MQVKKCLILFISFLFILLSFSPSVLGQEKGHIELKCIAEKEIEVINEKGENDTRPTLAFLRRLCDETDLTNNLHLYEDFYERDALLVECNNINYWIDVENFLNKIRMFDPVSIAELNNNGLKKIIRICQKLDVDSRINYMYRYILNVATTRNLRNEYLEYYDMLCTHNQQSNILIIFSWRDLDTLFSYLDKDNDKDNE